MQVLCDMETNGGGWSMVVKVSNQDTEQFITTGDNSPFQVNRQFATESMLDLEDKDALGVQYNQVKGTELMVLDGGGEEFVSGEYANNAVSLFQRMTDIGKGTAVSGNVRCAVNAQNIKKTGGAVGGITPVGLGLKCEDDNEQTWRCDDDAVYIGWAGDGSHRYGASKCGTDGGSDIYNGGNTKSSGFITIWVR